MKNVLDFIINNKPYFEDFITRSTYHSNGIDGSTLSYADTYALLFNDNSFRITGLPREIHEAINHKSAIEFAMDLIETQSILLTEDLIKSICIQVNSNIIDISGYRQNQTVIRGSEFIPSKPSEIYATMMHILNNYNDDTENNIYKKIALFHQNFERCQPFEDGNGRTGRLLMNYELINNNLPPIVIPKEERSKYFEMLFANDFTSIDTFSNYLCELSNKEFERMKLFGYLQ